MTRTVRIAVLMLAMAFFSPTDGQAHKSTGPWGPRFWDSCATENFSAHWANGAQIPVYINTYKLAGVPQPGSVERLAKGGGGFWAAADFARQVKIGLVEVNDTLGPSIRFYFAGETNSLTFPNAIVIRSRLSGFDNFVVARAFINTPCAAGHIISGEIEAEVFSGAGVYRPWSAFDAAQGSGTDIQLLMTHELGHIIGLWHSPLDATTPNPSVLNSLGQAYVSPDAIMNYTVVPNMRHFTKYERETLNSLYGEKIGTFKSWTSSTAQGLGTTWSAADNDIIAGQFPEFRMGTLSQRAQYSIFAWIGNSQVGLWRVQGMRKSASGSEVGLSMPSTESFSPPSVAYDFNNGTYRLVHLQKDPTQLVNAVGGPVYYPYGSQFLGVPARFIDKQICWLESTNGQTFQAGGCLTEPSGGQPIVVYTDQVTLAYDPTKKVWVTAWIDNSYFIHLYTIPTPGSAQSAPVHSTFGHLSWDAPTIACTGALTNGCLMVFRSYSETGYLITLRGSINSAGTWSTQTTWADGYDLDQVATPQISYQPAADFNFVLAYLKDDSRTIRAYKRPLGGTSTWGNGVTVTTSTTSISAPALGNDVQGSYRVVLGALQYAQ